MRADLPAIASGTDAAAAKLLPYNSGRPAVFGGQARRPSPLVRECVGSKAQHGCFRGRRRKVVGIAERRQSGERGPIRRPLATKAINGTLHPLVGQMGSTFWLVWPEPAGMRIQRWAMPATAPSTPPALARCPQTGGCSGGGWKPALLPECLSQTATMPLLEGRMGPVLLARVPPWLQLYQGQQHTIHTHTHQLLWQGGRF